MEFYWRFRDIPEFSGLEKAQQTEVWAATVGRRFRDPYMIVALFVCVVVVGLCYGLGDLLIPSSYGGVIGGGIGGGVGSFLSFGIMTPRARPHLAKEIRRRSW